MKMNLSRLLFAFLLVTTVLNAVPVLVGQSEPTVYVDPPMSFSESGELFNITLGITGAVDVYCWQVNLTYDPNMLEFQDAVEGDFLKDQPEGSSGLLKSEWVNSVFLIVSTRGDYMGVTGRGNLATVEFKAKEGITGESVLNISDPGRWNETLGYHLGGTQLFDHLEREIPRLTVDGYFSNTDYPPVASFTYSPSLPDVGETVYFNASDSYDPDGNIIRYEWDFGDGESLNETLPTTTHTYDDSGTFIASLTVIDDAGYPHVWYESFSTILEDVEIRAAHNVVVLTVTASPNTVRSGESVSVDVTVGNRGSWNETFAVNLYYDGHSAAPAQTVNDLAPDAENTLSFTWDTTDVAPGTYRVNATADPVEGEFHLTDNTRLSGTVTVEEAGGGFPIEYAAIVVVVVVVVIGVAAFFLLRRRGSATT